MKDRCDVAIVGGGPAGAATAIALARAGRSVVILEQSQYDRMRIGETLPPAARVPLARLEVWNRFVQQGHVPAPATVSAWGTNELDENHFVFNAHGHGWHLDRTLFDAMLVSAAADSGARVHRGARLTTYMPGAQPELEYLQDAVVHRLQTRFVVDATGRAAMLARRHGANRTRFDRLIGVVGVCSTSASRCEEDPRTLVEAVADGWWYSAVLPQSKLIVAYMTDADLIAKTFEGLHAYWRRQLDRTMYTFARVHGLTLEHPVRIVPACSEALDRVAGTTWVATGDAAMSVDPLSSQGIYTALQSGLVAARTVDLYLDGMPDAIHEPTNWTRRAFTRYWRMHQVQYAREQRWDSPFWKRRRAGADVQARVRSAVTETAAAG